MRVMFLVTSMPVGGAETLLVNLVRRLDRRRVEPELCCLKECGPLGEQLTGQVPVHAGLIRHKFDLAVLWRLRRLLRRRNIDAVVTVGAGDKMFWGRLAARLARVPVVCSALHSTGWPDGVGRLNRMLTSITDAFIAVARPHGEYLIEHEGFPANKVVVIPNGVDTNRFTPGGDDFHLREQLGIGPAAPVAVIVAALRPEKNHKMFLEVARRVRRDLCHTHFLVVGDGPERAQLVRLATEFDIAPYVHFLGTRSDIPNLLNLADVNVLVSHNEANPVSILEAMSTGTPTVATDVGSVGESVLDGETGFLVPAGDIDQATSRVVQLLTDPILRAEQGNTARQLVCERWSLDVMVGGYEDLLTGLLERKTGRRIAPVGPAPEAESVEPAMV
ncbi:glycosyltransferase [Aeoliella sp. ICT_H6.2]|uniref:Glycosyltransferase n=1 Tax=Aeoliella straminimaris TaxID=2954799 RepID=A0A9X2FFW8_9BACT|nr:glycosyltransferase [Aeoliella straminimaris]MCO6047287.1 glycosyltransferase [Aeoliella straminimaris]